MKKFIQKFAIVLVAVFMMFAPTQTTVSAQDTLLCDIFPFLSGIRFAEGLCSGDVNTSAEGAVDTGAQVIQFGLSLVFVGIIAFAIYIIIKAAVRYIRSEGNQDEVVEAQKAIKNVFIGIGALIVGIIGLVIILGIFNSASGNPLDSGANPSDIKDTLLNE